MTLQLVADGTIGPDAPVADCLPGFRLDPRITVRMLLQHTSGVFNFTGEYDDDGTFTPGIPATTAGQEWMDNRFTTYRTEELVRALVKEVFGSGQAGAAGAADPARWTGSTGVDPPPGCGCRAPGPAHRSTCESGLVSGGGVDGVVLRLPTRGGAAR
ncbi:serine hydrolase [Streptomyces sp. NPDC003035]|uniref:serine hydrolase n=1 Tax=Streptomyces sp. NPDC003035 TaxID=3364676 RepID=UPI003680D0DD